MINKAIMFATVAHSDQKRKGADKPYILHPLEAGIVVSQMKYDTDLICAAILHDTVEDAKVDYETIEVLFNKKISDLVKAQSEDKSKCWKERKQHTIDYYNSIATEDEKIVCLGDKLSNMRSLESDYKIVEEELWNRFNVKEKSQHKWYYESLVDALSSLQGFEEYQEFKKLVNKVFG
jgi:(p)ppGpp synthase/HD superfamily hydrolase